MSSQLCAQVMWPQGALFNRIRSPTFWCSSFIHSFIYLIKYSRVDVVIQKLTADIMLHSRQRNKQISSSSNSTKQTSKNDFHRAAANSDMTLHLSPADKAFMIKCSLIQFVLSHAHHQRSHFDNNMVNLHIKRLGCYRRIYGYEWVSPSTVV